MLQSVSRRDLEGNRCTGTFSTDSVTGALGAWNIRVAGGGPTINGYFFSNSIANFVTNGGPNNYGVANFGGSYINWDFVSPLNSTFSPINISSSAFFCAPCGNFSVSGTGGFAYVPEPTTWTMLVLGFGGLGAMIRRRSRAALSA